MFIPVWVLIALSAAAVIGLVVVAVMANRALSRFDREWNHNRRLWNG